MTRQDIYAMARAIRDSGADREARVLVADAVLAAYSDNATWVRHAESFHAIAASVQDA